MSLLKKKNSHFFLIKQPIRVEDRVSADTASWVRTEGFKNSK